MPTTTKIERKAVELNVADIQPDPRQARKRFDAEKLATLAASIKQDGLLNPILVRPNPHGEGYLLIAGERRWRACGSLGWATVTAVVHAVDEVTANVLALADNIEREDLTPIEEAQGLAQLVRRDFGGNASRAASRLGKPTKYVEDRIALLGLPDQVQELVANRRLAIAAALILAKLPAGDPDRIVRAAEAAVRRNMSTATLMAYLQPDDEVEPVDRNGDRRLPQPETVSAAIQTVYDKVDRGWPAWPKGVRETLAGQFSSLIDFLLQKIREVRPPGR